jgi:hypothetical protein
MKLRIGPIEILDATWEDLDELIERYGGKVECSASVAGSDDPPTPEHVPRRRTNGGHAPSDHVVLERLLNAGNAGVPTQDLGEILGRRGKSIRPGLMSWALRIGLVTDKNIDPFEDTRVGSRRGARLKPSFQPVARELLNRL